MRTEALIRAAVAALMLVGPVTHASGSGVLVQGTVWTGGSAPENFASVYHQLGPTGGTGGGTTSSGFGRFTLTVELGAIRVTGRAEHSGYVDFKHGEPQGQSFHGMYTRNEETEGFEGALLTIDSDMEFSFDSDSYAQGVDLVTYSISPVRIVPVSGQVTELGDGRARLTAGTYRLEVYLLAYNAIAPFVPWWQEWAGYDRDVSVRATEIDWSMTPVRRCQADLSGDGVVDGSDLTIVLAAWGPCPAGGVCASDISGDGVVDGSDLTPILAAWGPCAPSVPQWATLIESSPDPAVVHDADLREAIEASGYAWRVRDTTTQIEMVLIPPGTFQMGCSPSNQYSCLPDENPVHTVTLTQPFYMGRYEVTQAQWTARMGSNPSWFTDASAEVPLSQVPNRPVERVSWNAIQGFLSATGMRLPTEAEWEYAYRAGTTTAFHSMPGYPSGTNDDNQLGTIAWFGSNAAGQTRPVGQKAGNGFGLHDMSGNVWEWVNDWYSGSYYASSPSVNPPGPSSGSYRVVRGGSLHFDDSNRRSSERGLSVPASLGSSLGFRVARTP